MLTQNFKHLIRKDICTAGAKASFLGEMSNINLPVPPGFVVLAGVFDNFIKSSNLSADIRTILSQANYKDLNSVKGASVKIRNLISKIEFPPQVAETVFKEFSKLKTRHVAVRSSATADDSQIVSWAGELRTYLNVSKRNLLASIRDCWSSLFTPRAMFYRYQKKLRRCKISIAVIVQKMVQAEVSGVCFTLHPLTKNAGQMVIEAGFGLGESIVRGKITPDTYILQKHILKQKENLPYLLNGAHRRDIFSDFNSLEILDKNISEQKIKIIKNKIGNKEVNLPSTIQTKAKLNDGQILTLAGLCLRVEKHFKGPQDIEWAYAKGRFYLLQTRPIENL